MDRSEYVLPELLLERIWWLMSTECLQSCYVDNAAFV